MGGTMEILEFISAYLGYTVAAVSLLFVMFLGVEKLRQVLGVAPKRQEEHRFLDNFS